MRSISCGDGVRRSGNRARACRAGWPASSRIGTDQHGPESRATQRNVRVSGPEAGLFNVLDDDHHLAACRGGPARNQSHPQSLPDQWRSCTPRAGSEPPRKAAAGPSGRRAIPCNGVRRPRIRRRLRGSVEQPSRVPRSPAMRATGPAHARMRLRGPTRGHGAQSRRRWQSSRRHRCGTHAKRLVRHGFSRFPFRFEVWKDARSTPAATESARLRRTLALRSRPFNFRCVGRATVAIGHLPQQPAARP